jgi:hypothetical protein
MRRELQEKKMSAAADECYNEAERHKQKAILVAAAIAELEEPPTSPSDDESQAAAGGGTASDREDPVDALELDQLNLQTNAEAAERAAEPGVAVADDDVHGEGKEEYDGGEYIGNGQYRMRVGEWLVCAEERDDASPKIWINFVPLLRQRSQPQ